VKSDEAPGPTRTGAASELAVNSVEPSVVSNVHPARLTVIGAGFAPGLKVTVDGLSLTETRVESTTKLSGVLPGGLCPGTYRLTVTDARGQQVSVGQLVVQGVTTATLGDWEPQPAMNLNGRDRTLSVRLPTVLIHDTTCARGDWQLAFTLGRFSPFDDGRGALPLRSLQLDGSESRSTTLTTTSGGTSATLNVPHAAGQTSASIRPLIGVDVPSHAYAGQYRMSVAVSLAGGALDEGTRHPGGQR
jgi:hypothetical protein